MLVLKYIATTNSTALMVMTFVAQFRQIISVFFLYSFSLFFEKEEEGEDWPKHLRLYQKQKPEWTPPLLRRRHLLSQFIHTPFCTFFTHPLFPLNVLHYLWQSAQWHNTTTSAATTSAATTSCYFKVPFNSSLCVRICGWMNCEYKLCFFSWLHIFVILINFPVRTGIFQKN